MVGDGLELNHGIEERTEFVVRVHGVEADVQPVEQRIELVPVMHAGIGPSPLPVGSIGRDREDQRLSAGHVVDGQVHFLVAHPRIAAAHQHDGVVGRGVPLHHRRIVGAKVDLEPRFHEHPDHAGVFLRISHGVVDDKEAGGFREGFLRSCQAGRPQERG